jgi:hypothetical protein
MSIPSSENEHGSETPNPSLTETKSNPIRRTNMQTIHDNPPREVERRYMNQPSKFKSTMKWPFLFAACLILGVFAPPATELSRAASAQASPPINVSSTQIIPANTIAPGECAFDVQLSLSGKAGQINLPGNRVIFTSPKLTATLTNLSDTTKSVKLSVTGAFHELIDQNGNTTFVVTGRNLLGDPVAGFVLAIGTFSFVFDSSGNLIQPLMGTGQLIHVCTLIN